MTTHAPAKEAAGTTAAALVEDGMTLGLGTGSTVAAFLDALAARNLEVRGIPTSISTERRCAELGIPTIGTDAVDRVDLVVDGADELDSDLVLVKGGGGALLREKVVAAMGDEFVVIAGEDKLVDRLGDSFALPVEVIPFACRPVQRHLDRLGGVPRLRRDGVEPDVTDNGNWILDVHFPGGIEDPVALAAEISPIPGVAEHGLFVGLATSAILGRDDGTVRRLGRPGVRTRSTPPQR